MDASLTDIKGKALSARAALRRQRIAAREALDPEQHAALSQQVDRHLAAWFSGRSAAVLGFCWPHRGEFDARALAMRLLAVGWRACLPMVVAPATPMQFREWTPGMTMRLDRHGIPFPACGANLVPDVLLLPVNAFDEQGYRVGYGGGYFDRTLAALQPRPYALGVGFELARVADIGAEAHDIPLDAVVTERGIQVFPR